MYRERRLRDRLPRGVLAGRRGVVILLDPAPPASLDDKVREAVRACPAEVIVAFDGEMRS
jgi:hypothetical protein